MGFTQKEAYDYHNYMSSLEGATLSVKNPASTYILKNITPYQTAYHLAESFKEGVKSRENSSDFDDLFSQKLELSDDKIKLILAEIEARSALKYDNLKRLYQDLSRVENWRLSIPYPMNEAKDRTWADLNKSELQIWDSIRRELKDSHRDLSFPTKDLRESLLEFKLQKQKSDLMGGLDEMLEPDGYKPMERDMHYIENQN